jgi:hypothetical protein
LWTFSHQNGENTASVGMVAELSRADTGGSGGGKPELEHQNFT